MSLAARERAALADLLTDSGPDASTLCGTWSTRLLAAHLVIRERRPDTLPGIAVPGFDRWTSHVQGDYARRPYDELVALVRSGPGRLSPFHLPGVDALANGLEYSVHHEDVRRASPGWEPRRLPAPARDRLWQLAARRARWSLRRLPARLVIRRTDTDSACHTGHGQAGSVELRGDPLELLLYLSGRREVARVEVSGDPLAREALHAASLSL